VLTNIDEHTLKALFSSSELPGWNAHHFLSPTFRDEQLKINAQHKFEAAVGIILFYHHHELSVLFIQRTKDNGPHSGQIAFPGGTKENNETLLQAAYREIEEEIGIHPSILHYIAPLSSLYIPVSRFMVYPFVFFCNHLPPIQPNKSEVETTFVYPVRVFFEKEHISSTTIFLNQKEYQVPCFLMDETIIWGATSMIWNECLSILKPLINEQNQSTRSTT
jgi:8-oxo-dGTP pyrophosphatase MutT (NUDIX family)